jgi:hypothetical protein
VAIVATMADISNPGSLVAPYQAVAFYIGGMTPHVWTAAQLHAQTARWRLPIWVYGHEGGTAGGASEGAAAHAWAKSVNMPSTAMICIDMETAVDADYCNAFAANDGAHVTCVYGSGSTCFGNPRLSGGYWVAQYVESGAFVHAGSWATQWSDPAINRTSYDLSALSTVAHLWDWQPEFSVTVVDKVSRTASTHTKAIELR